MDWDGFLAAATSGILAKKMCEAAVPLVRQSLKAIAAGDARFFHTHLPTRETWRLYPDFGADALFLDIETTGLDCEHNDVTVIGALGAANWPSSSRDSILTSSRLRRTVPTPGHV